jgi:hypothetical protein
MKQLFAIALIGTVLPCGAQPAPKAVPAGEPEVQRSVIEDTGARIEELRVRGQVQRITVSPKFGGKAPYEIITGGGGTEIPGGVNAGRGAAGTAGKSAWNLLAF